MPWHMHGGRCDVAYAPSFAIVAHLRSSLGQRLMNQRIGGPVARWPGGPVARWPGGPVDRWPGGPVSCADPVSVDKSMTNWPLVDCSCCHIAHAPQGPQGQQGQQGFCGNTGPSRLSSTAGWVCTVLAIVLAAAHLLYLVLVRPYASLPNLYSSQPSVLAMHSLNHSRLTQSTHLKDSTSRLQLQLQR